jgi:hypothetical protein
MRLRTIAAACAGLALAATVNAPAHAQEMGSVSPPPPSPSSPRVTPWEATLGLRGGYVESPGYSPFSPNDFFSGVSLGASRVVAVRGRFALAVGATWDYGEPTSTARGAKTDLEVHRLTAPLTLRVRVRRWLDAFARVAPGATFVRASVDDPSGIATLRKSAWLPSGDATAGVAWTFADSRIAGRPVVWRLTAEGGYGWTADMAMQLQPDLGSGDPRQTGATDLGILALSGGFGRIGVAVGF